MDERPLADQGLADVLGYLEQAIGENLTLDYKREISPDKPKDNAELCKDVSAFANSADGMIFYGVDEKKPERTPALPPQGIPRRFGRQPVEEWGAQVLASGVQPPMDFEIGVYELRKDWTKRPPRHEYLPDQEPEIRLAYAFSVSGSSRERTPSI